MANKKAGIGTLGTILLVLAGLICLVIVAALISKNSGNILDHLPFP